MKAPARLLNSNGVKVGSLARVTGQSVQYVSMQLNDVRPMTYDLLAALEELVDDPWIIKQVIAARGKE